MAIHKIKCSSNEEWLEERRKSIGGSDAGTICGYNKYSTPFALWAEKTGAIEPEDISDKEAVRLGNDLEPYVAERFTEATGKKVRRCNYTFRNDDYPFAHANIDREVFEKSKTGLEIKTTSNYEYIHLCEQGEYPPVWYCQILHYMMVTGWKKWYLAVLCFGRGFYIFEIERTPEIEKEIEALANIERGFWKQVEERVAPDLDGMEATSTAINSIFDHSNGEAVDLGTIEIHLRQYESLERQIKQLERLLEEEKNQIKVFMTDSEKGYCGAYSVSWKEQERKTFDRKYFEAHYGKIPEDCFKSSVSRPFKFTVKEI